ncbi:MAG: hypothetical protein LH480_13230 [Rubrivivax sp.]|nr:hypothetical protein [Rubrivivax sp.]
MNTTRPVTQTTQTGRNRFVALALSTVLTVAMLMGVDQLAVSDAPAALLAQMQGSRA